MEARGHPNNHMELTPYHAKYFAYELTRRYSSDSLQKLAASLSDAQVDLKVDVRKENLINEIEVRMKQKTETNELFTIKWKIV